MNTVRLTFFEWLFVVVWHVGWSLFLVGLCMAIGYQFCKDVYGIKDKKHKP